MTRNRLDHHLLTLQQDAAALKVEVERIFQPALSEIRRAATEASPKGAASAHLGPEDTTFSASNADVAAGAQMMWDIQEMAREIHAAVANIVPRTTFALAPHHLPKRVEETANLLLHLTSDEHIRDCYPALDQLANLYPALDDALDALDVAGLEAAKRLRSSPLAQPETGTPQSIPQRG